MKKILFLSIILLAVFAVMSCDKEDNDSDNGGGAPVVGVQTMKELVYDENDRLVCSYEYTFNNNYQCVERVANGSVQKTETWQTKDKARTLVSEKVGDVWEVVTETITKKDSQGRPLQETTIEGNPGMMKELKSYYYSADTSAVITYFSGAAEPSTKNVTINKDKNTTEYIFYSYLGNYQWKELLHETREVVYANDADEKAHKNKYDITYDADGNEKSRKEYVWNGDSYKEYIMVDGEKYLFVESITDGDNSTVITYSTTNLSIPDTPKPYSKVETKKIGNMTEVRSYYYSGEWVLWQKKIRYVE